MGEVWQRVSPSSFRSTVTVEPHSLEWAVALASGARAGRAAGCRPPVRECACCRSRLASACIVCGCARDIAERSRRIAEYKGIEPRNGEMDAIVKPRERALEPRPPELRSRRRPRGGGSGGAHADALGRRRSGPRGPRRHAAARRQGLRGAFRRLSDEARPTSSTGCSRKSAATTTSCSCATSRSARIASTTWCRSTAGPHRLLPHEGRGRAVQARPRRRHLCPPPADAGDHDGRRSPTPSTRRCGRAASP